MSKAWNEHMDKMGVVQRVMAALPAKMATGSDRNNCGGLRERASDLPDLACGCPVCPSFLDLNGKRRGRCVLGWAAPGTADEELPLVPGGPQARTRARAVSIGATDDEP